MPSPFQTLDHGVSAPREVPSREYPSSRPSLLGLASNSGQTSLMLAARGDNLSLNLFNAPLSDTL